jgi:hypothetical protein
MKRIGNWGLAALVALLFCFPPTLAMAEDMDVNVDEPLITISTGDISYKEFGEPVIIDPEITISEAVYGKLMKVVISSNGSGNLFFQDLDINNLPESVEIESSANERFPQLTVTGTMEPTYWRDILQKTAFVLIPEQLSPEYSPDLSNTRVITFESSIWSEAENEDQGSWSEFAVYGTKMIKLDVLEPEDPPTDDEEEEQEPPIVVNPPVDDEEEEQEPPIVVNPPVDDEEEEQEPPIVVNPPVDDEEEEQEPPIVVNPPVDDEEDNPPAEQQPPPADPKNSTDHQQAPKFGTGESLPIGKIQAALTQAGVKDIKADHYAAGSFMVLIESGLLVPDRNGNILPYAPLNIGEGVAVFAKILGIASKTDTPEQSLEKAKQSGIVRQGLDAGTSFRRVDVAQLLATALGITPKVITGPKDYPFADYDTTPAEVRGILAALYELGIFKGFEDKTFRPDSVLTRSEIAVLVDRILGASQ